MSDAGKIMIGTDGNPLRSADGKIVLADELYPRTAIPTDWVSFPGYGIYPTGQDEDTRWARAAYAFSIEDYPLCDTLLRAETWLSPFLQEASIRINIFEYEGQYAIDLTQIAVKYIISSWAGSIDWPRVKKITFDWTLRCERTPGDTSVEAVNFRLFVGQGASVTEPSGSNEPWEGTGWSQVYSGPVSGSTPATGTTETSIGESGGNLYFAVSADNTTSPNLVDQDAFFVLERFNIVYNLATA